LSAPSADTILVWALVFVLVSAEGWSVGSCGRVLLSVLPPATPGGASRVETVIVGVCMCVCVRLCVFVCACVCAQVRLELRL